MMFDEVKKQYEKLGADVEKAFEILKNTPISIQCWQGDDIQGFYSKNDLSGGIQVTGNYPYRARNIDELREDIDQVINMIPGKLKLNLHAIYLDTKTSVELDMIEPIHYKTWVDYAKKRGIGLDFNPTCFSHEKSSSGFTLSSNDKEVRDFWIRHCKQSRKVASYFAQELNEKSIVNIWIPDGYKDYPVSRINPRKHLINSLDEIYNESHEGIIDTLESKLFGIGSEAYTTGTSEFYLGYAIKNKKSVCLDMGHFHPTESVADKLSTVSLYTKDILLHISRPERWDSDHVVSYNDELLRVMESIVRDGLLDRTHIGLDFFDASINRVAGWIIGIRNTQKALLKALLEPQKILLDAEKNEDYTTRLVLLEEIKMLPIGIVYDEFCRRENKLGNLEWLKEIKKYESTLRGKRI